ncbi:MAG: ABC transporter substrate-binding protein [Dehalococcoidia bacterium]|nr:ABC transporter substrate-binding protein [Dehalococcoidia bacterium]
MPTGILEQLKSGSHTPVRACLAMAMAAWLLAVMFLLAACSSEVVTGQQVVSTAIPATPTPVPTATPDPADALANVEGIVDPANRGWPRVIEALNGRVTIDEQPQRIVTISLGHDEVTYALVPRDRVVAANIYTQSADQSNVAHLAAGLPEITSDAEVIVAQSPDIVIASPFTSLELIDALERVGLTVLQTDLHNDPDGRRQDILLLGYAYGVEVRAIEFVKEVEDREAALRSVWKNKPEDERVRVMSATLYSDSLYTAGAGSTEGEIINAAGGINVAAEAGLEHNPVISYESLIAMDPEVIFIPQPAEWGGEEFRDGLLANPALASVPAIRDGRVFMADPKFYTTLSFWNLRGAEELARDLWPEDVGDTVFGSFSFPSE